MSDYKFVTVWKIAAPIERVWEAINHPEEWPTWWRGMEQVIKLEPGDEHGVGSVRRYVCKSRLPYQLVFTMRTTRVERPRLLVGEAFGELEGTGRWEFEMDGNLTVARYTWTVKTAKAWMNLLAPVARPLFEWNHDVIMRWGAEGLGRLLEAESISIESR
jgi:uncharacterized protein YndB with AHSA1/START domain